MAIAYRGAGGNVKRAPSGTGALSVPVPAGTVAGDLLLLFVSAYQAGTGGPTITTPAGWTLIDTKTNWAANSARTALFWKIAGASEGPASVNTGATSFLDCGTVGYSGVDGVTPIDVTALWATGASTATIPVPSITTVTAGAEWVVVAGDVASSLTSASKPAGWTQQWLGSTSVAAVQYAVDSVSVASPGATTATSFTRTSSGTNEFIKIGIGLRPAAAAGAAFVPQVVII